MKKIGCILILLMILFSIGCNKTTKPKQSTTQKANDITYTKEGLPVVDYSLDGYSAVIDGDIMVVSQRQNLQIVNLKKKQIIGTINLPKGTANGVGISGNIVVWSDLRNETRSIEGIGDFSRANADIFSYNIKTGQTKQITYDTKAQTNPKIWQNYLVWEDSRNDKTVTGNKTQNDICLYNMDTGEEKFLTQSGINTNPAIRDNKVVWEDGRNVKDPVLRGGGNLPNNNTDIYMYDIKTGTTISVATGPYKESVPDVFGNYIVWEDRNNGNQADIVLYDSNRKEKKQITKDQYGQSTPQIYDNYIVWMDERRGHATNDLIVNGQTPNADIFMYNLITNTEKRMTGDEVQMMPVISNNWIAYVFSRQTEPKIEVVRYK